MDYQTFGQQYGQRQQQQPNTGGFSTMPRPTATPYQTQMPAAPRAPYQAPSYQPSAGATLQMKGQPAPGGYDGSGYGAGIAPQAHPQPMQQPQQPAYNSAAWNTDGFAKPNYIAPTANRANVGAVNSQKWNDPNHQTPKYTTLRILSNFPHTVAGLGQAMGDVQRAYPQASWNGKDMVDLDGPGPMGAVDVLKGAGAGGKGWQWGAGSPQQPQQPAGAGGQDNIFAALLKAASGGFSQQPQQPQVDQNAFLGQLQQLFSQYQAAPQQNGPRIVWG